MARVRWGRRYNEGVDGGGGQDGGKAGPGHGSLCMIQTSL